MCAKHAGLRRYTRAFALGIFLVAFGLRLIPVLLTRHLGIGLDDMFRYDMLARRIGSGNGFRWYAPADLGRLTPYLHLILAQMSLDPRGMLTTFRAPLYPALLSRVHYVSGIDDLELRDFTYFYVNNSVGLLQPPVLIATLACAGITLCLCLLIRRFRRNACLKRAREHVDNIAAHGLHSAGYIHIVGGTVPPYPDSIVCDTCCRILVIWVLRGSIAGWTSGIHLRTFHRVAAFQLGPGAKPGLARHHAKCSDLRAINSICPTKRGT